MVLGRAIELVGGVLAGLLVSLIGLVWPLWFQTDRVLPDASSV